MQWIRQCLHQFLLEIVGKSSDSEPDYHEYEISVSNIDNDDGDGEKRSIFS